MTNPEGFDAVHEAVLMLSYALKEQSASASGYMTIILKPNDFMTLKSIVSPNFIDLPTLISSNQLTLGPARFVMEGYE